VLTLLVCCSCFEYVCCTVEGMINNSRILGTEIIETSFKERVSYSKNFQLDHNINIPLPVIVEVIKNNHLPLLRTYLYLKYFKTVSGDGRYIVSLKQLSMVMGYTRQTANIHIKKLKRLGWITDDFVRGWRGVVELYVNDTRKRVQSARIPAQYLTSNRTLRASCIYSILRYNHRTQTYLEGKRRTANIGAILRPISAKKVGEWFNLSKMTGSYYRKMLKGFGLIRMINIFTLTNFTQGEVLDIRCTDQGDNLIWYCKGQCYAYQECNRLLPISELITTRSKALR